QMIADSVRQPTIPRYIGYSLSGIVGREGPISSRGEAVRNVFACLMNNSVIHIQSPPFSGKSSFALLLAQAASSRNMAAFYITLTPHTHLDALFQSWCGVSLIALMMGVSPAMVIFD